MAKIKTWTDGEVLAAEDVNDILNPDVPSGAAAVSASGTLTLALGFSGAVSWTAVGRDVEVQFDVSGSVTSDVKLTSSMLPAIYRPSSAFPIIPASAYFDPATARPQASAYMSNSGDLRAVSPAVAMTRVRGVAKWRVAV
jgi:hypothetical protein